MIYLLTVSINHSIILIIDYFITQLIDFYRLIVAAYGHTCHKIRYLFIGILPLLTYTGHVMTSRQKVCSDFKEVRFQCLQVHVSLL
jgi:hypothetical protein